MFYYFLQVNPPMAPGNTFDEQANIVYYHAELGQFSV